MERYECTITDTEGYVCKHPVVFKDWSNTVIVLASSIDFANRTFNGTVIWVSKDSIYSKPFQVGQTVINLSLDNYENVDAIISIRM
jgi:hypothetical protein